MKKIYSIILFCALLINFLVYANKSLAKTDLSITENDVTFSKNEPLEGDLVRVYARVVNSGDNDMSGYVIFLSSGKEMAAHQVISVKPNTYDDVFIDWRVKAGTYNIEVKITDPSLVEDNIENNEIIKKSFFIDLDTDKDGVGDNKDPDKDNDGLTNEEEVSKGTNPLVADTDGDKVNDKVDTFPTNKTEWHDTDSDGVGDNKDADADGDGLTNIKEVTDYGTNPLAPDSDNDGLGDKQEAQTNTDPNKPDTDGDGTIDSKDSSPLDPSIATASLMGSLTNLFKNKNSPYFVFGGIGALLVLIFLFRKKRG